MPIKTISSSNESVEQAVQDIVAQAGGAAPKCIIYFASPIFAPDKLCKTLSEVFPEVTSFGCTTAGEIISGKMLTNSLVVMLLEDDIVEDVCVELASNISEKDPVPGAFDRLGGHYNEPVDSMNIDKYLGIVLLDGLSGREEAIMDSIGNQTDITFIGGAAGDNLNFKKTCVSANSESQSNAAVLAILKLKRGFDIIKTQSFKSLNKKLIATKVNEKERRVYSFNHKPAIMAYAEALGCTESEAENRFMRNPVGLMAGDEPYIRSPQRVEKTDMLFYCNIKEGMSLQLMEATNILEDTQKAVSEKIDELGSVSGIIDFHCILRTLELRMEDQCHAYGEIFSDVPTIGFSTYGEEYIGHINQTSTMLIFK